ncbi:MerR family transcriptional regulator [Planococcus sp. ISL-109]|uniref:MerR family transcriptional regulator n=1 Tax=Planococcus sp. ISL-109 TaxID=2819166 RepID=UPI00333E0761
MQKLAALAGVSARTLRYYDAIGLLAAPKNASGYRLYGTAEVDRLQQILFYRELGFGLGDIAKLLDDPHFNEAEALSEYRRQLIDKRSRLDLLIHTVETTISAKKGESDMNDHEKFEGFKDKMVEGNEAAYSGGIREKYGDKIMDASNAKMLKMDEE